MSYSLRRPNIRDIALHIYINRPERKIMKYTFEKMYIRLHSLPAADGVIVEVNLNQIMNVALPNLTLPEMLVSFLIEYFIARKFEVSFDNGIEFLNDGIRWREHFPVGFNQCLFSITFRIHNMTVEVECGIGRSIVTVSLYHTRSERSYPATIPIRYFRAVHSALVRGLMDEAELQFSTTIMLHLDPQFAAVFDALFGNRDPPPRIATPM